MDAQSRLSAVITYSKKTTRAFAIECGLQQPTVDRQVKGLRAVSLETIQAIAMAYPEISRDWLLLGEGEMLKGTATQESERIERLVDTIATLQSALNDKQAIAAALAERVRQLEMLTKTK